MRYAISNCGFIARQMFGDVSCWVVEVLGHYAPGVGRDNSGIVFCSQDSVIQHPVNFFLPCTCVWTDNKVS